LHSNGRFQTGKKAAIVGSGAVDKRFGSLPKWNRSDTMHAKVRAPGLLRRQIP